MKLFDPYSPFLRSFQAALNELGGGTDTTVRKVGTETLSESYFPKNKHGVPSFDWEQEVWESSGRMPTEPENLMLDANHQGELRIRQGDGGTYFETQLRSGFELAEVLEFVETADAERIGSSKWVQWNLQHLLEDIYLLMPGTPGLMLIPFDGQKFHAERPNWSFSSVIAKEDLLGAFTPSVMPRNDDLVLESGGSLHMLGFYMQDADSYFAGAAQIVLRFKKEVSKMWLADYFEHALEGADIAKQIFAEWKMLPGILKNIVLEIPSVKRDQVALSIETREAKRHYQEVIQNLVNEREPIRKIIPLYRKRIQSVAVIHGDLLEEITALRAPLPFFIEYPLHRFSRGDDRLDRVVRAQQLLTVLVKSLVLLPLEEALGQTGSPPTIRLMAENLSHGKKLSDGDWVNELLSCLRKSCRDGSFLLPLFGQLLSGSSEIESELKLLVEARNRYHHPPNDADGMLELFQTKLPIIVDFLRRQFAGIQFLIPQSLQFTDGLKSVRALQLTGFDTEFQSAELKVTAPLESFPSGKIVATDIAGTRAVVLSRFFTSKSLKAETVDLGIFDRVEGDETCFEFVRGLGRNSKLLPDS